MLPSRRSACSSALLCPPPSRSAGHVGQQQPGRSLHGLGVQPPRCRGHHPRVLQGSRVRAESLGQQPHSGALQCAAPRMPSHAAADCMSTLPCRSAPRRLESLPLFGLGVSVGGGFVAKLPQYLKARLQAVLASAPPFRPLFHCGVAAFGDTPWPAAARGCSRLQAVA